MTVCYVWNCTRKAVIFIELTTSPHKRMPCCQEHADEFPPEYPRVDTDEHGKKVTETSNEFSEKHVVSEGEAKR